ncbi:MAG: holo-ACP synthase [Verrucomicrobia bacterium]|nr:holo-ACP synthase [Verrucomicrobiota bacterium]
MTNAETQPIIGIGNDIIEIERIRKSIDTHGLRLLSKLFTTKEQDYCLKHKDPVPHFAGRFSAKEAVVKALGTGFGEHASWLDFEILNDAHGKPSVLFSPKMGKKLQGTSILVSISHCQLYVTAFAIWVKIN